MEEYYRITGYDTNLNCHICKNSEGKFARIVINGDLPIDTNPLSLIGKTFFCSYIFPYISIAISAKIKD